MTRRRPGLSPALQFLLTRPSRDVTRFQHLTGLQDVFLLTRPSRDVTKPALPVICTACISTHTSLAGRDGDPGAVHEGDQISTHTSLAGRDNKGGEGYAL